LVRLRTSTSGYSAEETVTSERNREDRRCDAPRDPTSNSGTCHDILLPSIQ